MYEYIIVAEPFIAVDKMNEYMNSVLDGDNALVYEHVYKLAMFNVLGRWMIFSKNFQALIIISY